MKRILESKDLKPAHQKILRAILSSAQEPSSRLTATEPLVLLRQIITIADDENEEEHSNAIRELVGARWIIGISTNPSSGLVQYRLSHTANLYIRKLDNTTVSKEMAGSHMNTKRRFTRLSDVEKDALARLRACNGTSSPGPTLLARRMTGDDSLRTSDDAAQVYIQLLREGWIIATEQGQREGTAFYKVSPDYPALQPA